MTFFHALESLNPLLLLVIIYLERQRRIDAEDSLRRIIDSQWACHEALANCHKTLADWVRSISSAQNKDLDDKIRAWNDARRASQKGPLS